MGIGRLSAKSRNRHGEGMLQSLISKCRAKYLVISLLKYFCLWLLFGEGTFRVYCGLQACLIQLLFLDFQSLTLVFLYCYNFVFELVLTLRCCRALVVTVIVNVIVVLTYKNCSVAEIL